MGRNNAFVTGNIGRINPLKFTPQGTAVLNIALATNNSHYDKTANEWVNHETVWYDISLWGKDAEYAVEIGIDKGDQMVCWGEIELHKYQAKDGSEGVTLKMNKIDAWGYKPKHKTIGAGQQSQEEPW